MTTSDSRSAATAGGKLFLRPGPFHDHRLRVIEYGEPFFEKHGPKAVFLGRWTTGLRIASAWLAGMNKMSWPTFLFWNALGGIVWAASIGFAVYLLGDVAERIIVVAGPVAAGVAVVALIVFIVWRRRKRARTVRCPPVRAALLAVVLLLLVPAAASAGPVVSVRGAAGPGPARYDRVSYERFGPASAKRVLILVPGTQGGAGDFSIVGPEIVKRVKGLQVWAYDRRTQALEDHKGFATGDPDQAFAYYLQGGGFAPSPARPSRSRASGGSSSRSRTCARS